MCLVGVNSDEKNGQNLLNLQVVNDNCICKQVRWFPMQAQLGIPSSLWLPTQQGYYEPTSGGKTIVASPIILSLAFPPSTHKSQPGKAMPRSGGGRGSNRHTSGAAPNGTGLWNFTTDQVWTLYHVGYVAPPNIQYLGGWIVEPIAGTQFLALEYYFVNS